MTTKLLSDHKLFSKYCKEVTEEEVNNIIRDIRTDGNTFTDATPRNIIDAIWDATDENTILVELDKYFDHVLDDMVLKEGRYFESKTWLHLYYLLIDILNNTIEEKFEEFDIYIDKIIRNSFAHARQEAELKERKKQQEPDEVIEVQPKAKKKPQEEQVKQEQVNRKAAARETINKLTNGIKIVPADANVSKVAAAMNANNGRVRPDFSAFVQQPIYPEPQYNGFVPTIQPTASQVNVPQYNSNVMTGQPIQPQGPAQYNENIVQNVQQQQPVTTGPRHLPKFENKKGLYNMNTLTGVDIKEKADVIHQHYKLISGAHKDTLEVQIDVLMSLITSHQIYNECKKNKVIIPSTGLTFTEIPVETYGNRVDLSKFDMAFRIDQQTKTGENLIVYTNTMNSKTLRQAIFLPSSNPKKTNNQMAGHNHPDGCGCGHC